ncbi:hypothetical protein [Nostoc sp. NOS(2021)]|nr:hypothetical protein [Nostoc sp. NOS(2021)]
MTIRITVDETKLIFELLLQRIKDDQIEFVDVETDFYWLITSDIMSG